MAKTKTVFFCTNCGNETPKWMGRCPGCGAFNTMEEHIEKPVAAGKAKPAPVGMSRHPQRIREVASDGEIRFSTGMGELDRVLGGGAVYFGLNTLLKLPFSSAFLSSGTTLAYLVRVLRYALILFAVVALYPLLFDRFGKKPARK
mgnify:CR=1 FL=1